MKWNKERKREKKRKEERKRKRKKHNNKKRNKKEKKEYIYIYMVCDLLGSQRESVRSRETGQYIKSEKRRWKNST